MPTKPTKSRASGQPSQRQRTTTTIKKRPAAQNTTPERVLEQQRQYKKKMKEAAEKKKENAAKYNATKAARNGGTYTLYVLRYTEEQLSKADS